MHATFFGAGGVIGYQKDDDEGSEPDGHGEKEGGSVVVAKRFDD